MAFSDLGSLGATGSTANNQSTLALTTAAAANVGELVVLVIADDNQGSGADADGGEVSSITDNSTGGPNTWTKAIGWANNNAAAQAGAAVQIWYSIITHQIANGGSITITFANATLSDATAVTARHFSLATSGVVIAGTNTLSNDAADPGSLDATTANLACLRIRGIASAVGNNTSLTPTTNWTAWANGNSATTGTTAEMCARAEHHISTGTGDASDPTYVAADCASAYVAFRETIATAKSITTTQANTATERVSVGKRNAMTQAQSASGTALVSIRSSQTGSGLAQIITAVENFVSSGASTTQKALSFAQAQAVTLLRATNSRVLVSQSYNASGTSVATILSSQTGTGVGELITSAANFVAAGGVTTQKAISITQAQAATVRRAILKLASVAQGQAATVLRAISRRVVSAHSVLATLLRITGHRILSSHGLTVTGSRSFGILKSINVTQAQSVTIRRLLGRFVILTQAQVPSIRRVISTSIRCAQAQTVTLLRTMGRKSNVSQSYNVSGVAEAHVLSTQTGSGLAQALIASAAPSIRTTQKVLSFTTSIVASGVALATVTLTQTGSGLGQRVTVTRLLIQSTFFKVISVATSYALAITLEVHDNLTMPQADINQSVIVRKSVARRILAVLSGFSIVVWRPVRHTVQLLQAQAVTVIRANLRLSKVITVAVVQSITVSRLFAWSKRITSGLANSVTVPRTIGRRVVSGVAQSLTVFRAKALQRIISSAHGTAVVIRNSAGKVIASGHAQVVSMRTAIQKRVMVLQSYALSFSTGSMLVVSKALSFAHTQSINVLRSTNTIIRLAQAQMWAAIRSTGKAFRLTLAQSAVFSAIKRAQQQISVVQSQVVMALGTTANAIRASLAQSVTVLRPVSHEILPDIAQSVRLSAKNTGVAFVQAISSAQSQIVQIAFTRSKFVAAQITHAVSIVRGMSVRILISVSQSAFAGFGSRVVQLAISVTQPQFWRLLKRYFVPTDPDRILYVAADDREIFVSADDRSLHADPDDRTVEVAADVRSLAA